MQSTQHPAPVERRRTKRLELALHPEELEVVEALASASGHRAAAWLRHLALNQAPPPRRERGAVRVPPEARELLMQLAPLTADLRGLAGNTNQLIKHLNEATSAGRLPDLSTAAAAVKSVMRVDQRLDLLRDEIKRLQLILLSGE